MVRTRISKVTYRHLCFSKEEGGQDPLSPTLDPPMNIKARNQASGCVLTSELTQLSVTSLYSLEFQTNFGFVLHFTQQPRNKGNTAKSLFEAPMEAIDIGPAISCYMVNPIGLPPGDNHYQTRQSFFLFNSFPTNGDFCCLLITFAISSHSDQV